MLKSTQAKVLTAIFALTLATIANAQVLVGGFQGAGDPTDAGWINPHTGSPITSDSYCSFPSGVVPGYAQSLAITWPSTNNGSFGYPSLELQFSPAQIQAFGTNAWITVTYSVPTGTNTAGYSQLYNIALNAPGFGYHNVNAAGWTNAMFSGNTNNNSPEPNYYFYSGEPSLFSQVVSLNYSAVRAAIETGISNSVATNGPSYLQMTFQGNQGGGAPTNWYINNVILSQAAFGEGVIASNVYWVDDFSTNGVGPTNPTNYDYFDSSTQEVYSIGDITNVYADWFGNGLTNGLSWSTNNPNNNPAFGSLQLNLTPGAGQFVLHHADYSVNPGISSLVYTDVEMDIRYDPSSITSVSGGTTNFGPLRIGVRPNGVYNVQDWFYYITPVLSTDTNWVHIVAPLSSADVNQQSWGELMIGEDPSVGGWNGQGNQTLYVANIKFVGPQLVAKTPQPTVSMLPAKPGLRIFAGSTVNTYDRASVSTVSQSESWIGGSFPVSYSFSLLSYPNNNINQTMVQILPIGPLTAAGNTYLGGTFPAGGNEYADYQDPNGMWLVLAPNGGGAVTATVEWKTNLPNANPNQIAMTFTNPTAIGNWTWTFTGPNAGTVTAPGGRVQPFTITDTNVTADFANPCAAVFGLQPNSTAGEGLWEDWGSVAISGTGGSVSDDWTHQTADFSSGVSPDGNFSAQGSANPPEVIISRNGLDAYWFSWTTPIPATGFGVVAGTNLLSSPSTWVDPPYYSGNSDFFPPRADSAVLLASKYWTLMPYDDLPTVDGNPQPSPPAITDPLAPNAYWIGTTNFNNQYP